jgi:ABC-type nitrate/sulfonate/bicarbonate transport system substrate-binding protein
MTREADRDRIVDGLRKKPREDFMLWSAPRLCASIAEIALRTLPLALCLAAAPAGAQDLILVRVNTFASANNLPLHAGIANGIFAKRGLKLEIQFTANSDDQRKGLAAGTADIVHSAADNAVAMVETAHEDVIVVAGGDSGMNEFFVRPEIKSFADIRGHRLVVDAPNTAFALLGKKILLKNGLKEGNYELKAAGNSGLRFKAMTEDKENVAAILGLPISLQAEAAGMKNLGRAVDLLGPYQGGVIFVMRPWAQANAPLLERYLAAYVESVRWVLDPAHRADAVAMLGDKLKLTPDVAERTYKILVEPAFGLAPDAKLDLDGFKSMLGLRAEIEGGQPAAPERYIDLGYYQRAVQATGR